MHGAKEDTFTETTELKPGPELRLSILSFVSFVRLTRRGLLSVENRSQRLDGHLNKKTKRIFQRICATSNNTGSGS